MEPFKTRPSVLGHSRKRTVFKSPLPGTREHDVCFHCRRSCHIVCEGNDGFVSEVAGFCGYWCPVRWCENSAGWGFFGSWWRSRWGGWGTSMECPLLTRPWGSQDAPLRGCGLVCISSARRVRWLSVLGGAGWSQGPQAFVRCAWAWGS